MTPAQQNELHRVAAKAVLERTKKPEMAIEYLVANNCDLELAKQFVGEVSGTKREPLVITSLTELKKRTFTPRLVLLETTTGSPVFHERSLNQGHAWRGVGKSHLLFGFFNAMACGSECLCYKAPQELPVLYIEGETPNVELQETTEHLAADNENFKLITLEDQPGLVIPKIATQEGRDLIEEAIVKSGTKVIGLDSISSLANIDMNKEESWLDIGPWFLRLRGMGLGVFYLQHDGKGGLQRGHSKQEDFLDKSFQLTWPSGYLGAEGLKCDLKFDKARQRMREGNNLSIEFSDGEWTYLTIDDSKKEQALQMIADDCSRRDICKELKISPKTLTAWKKEAEAQAAKPEPKTTDQGALYEPEQPDAY
jgi:hypothetical protein